MTTLDLDGLNKTLQELGLDPLPSLPKAHVLCKPLDILRSYLANILHRLIDRDVLATYDSIQWPNNISAGDLTIPLPRISHDADLNACAMDLLEQVWQLCCSLFWSNSHAYSSQNAPFLSCLL